MSYELSNTDFHIIRLDPFGRGISPEPKSLILKALPGEEGSYTPIKYANGTNWGVVDHPDKLKIASLQRISPTCPHYFSCGGCDYLHTTYEFELQLKLKALDFFLTPISKQTLLPAVTLHSGDRFYYRRKMSLSYQIDPLLLGQVSVFNNIIDTPFCLLPNLGFSDWIQSMIPQLKKEILQRDDLPKQGKVDFYFHPDEPHAYSYYFQSSGTSSPGFIQVNAKMNQKIIELVQKALPHLSNTYILDLFGGQGNLTQNFSCKIFCLDIYQGKIIKRKNTQYVNFDLYRSPPKLLRSQFSLPSKTPVFIVNPPREGFPNLKKWVDEFRPKNLLYLSCFAKTMVSDLQPLLNYYQIQSCDLIDMFPGTKHFETLVVLTKI